MTTPRQRVTPESITAELVELAAVGQPGPAGILVDFIYGWVEAILKNSADAEDATQDAFVAVLQAVRAGNFDRDSGKPRSWVTQVAVRKAFDHCRRRRRQTNRQEQDVYVDEIPPPSRRDVNTLIDAERAIKSLDEEERAILLLRYFEGLSLEEVANVLLLPVGTVKSRTFRAYSKLRSLIRSREVSGYIFTASRGKA